MYTVGSRYNQKLFALPKSAQTQGNCTDFENYKKPNDLRVTSVYSEKPIFAN